MTAKTLSLFVGILLVPATASAGMYLDIRDTVTEEMQKYTSELQVQRYVKEVIKPFGSTLTEENVDQALAGELGGTNLCGTVFGGFTFCPFGEEVVRAEIDRVSPVRQLGRDIQAAIAGYELTADGYTGREDTSASLQLAGIVNIWQSGVDELITVHGAGKIRTGTVPEPDDLKPHLNALEGALGALVEMGSGPYDPAKIDRQKLASAVWRYRHGYKKVKASGSCNNGEGDGSSLELLTVRWCDVEDALEDLWNELPSEFTPPLGKKETVIFPSVTLEGLNVIVWMRSDDAGIIWKIPTEPVLPSLLSLTGGVIVYGDYPEIEPGVRLADFIEGGPAENPIPTAPVERSICSHPVGKRGYLCRPHMAAECPEDPPATPANEIRLSDCVKENTRHPVQLTESGPDMCQIGGWRLPLEGGNFSGDDWSAGDDVSGQCKNCYIELGCAGAGSNCTWGLTQPKQADGKIRVCASGDAIPARYVLMKEVSHAQTMCHRNVGLTHSTAEECCSSYWYPSLVACSAMINDGVLNDTDFSAEECASILTDKGCETNFGANACAQIPLKPERVQEFRDAANTVGQSCGDAVSEKDPRIVSLMESAPMLCDPNCKVQYENTIGNNLCYISQCIEQSTEFHRIIPGRIPFVTQDQAFPWDACVNEDPQLGNLGEIPQPDLNVIPPYRGQQLIGEFERYFCSIAGGPQAILPALCSISETRSVGLPSETALGTMQQQSETTTEEQRIIREISSTIGNVSARIATETQLRYLDSAMNHLASLLDSLTEILAGIGEVGFPDVMCPRYHIDGCAEFDPVVVTP